MTATLDVTDLRKQFSVGRPAIDGMSFAPEAEQRAFVAAHPDLYEKKDGKPARLKAMGGKLLLGSLDGPGFAVSADMDFKSMKPMTSGAAT